VLAIFDLERFSAVRDYQVQQGHEARAVAPRSWASCRERRWRNARPNPSAGPSRPTTMHRSPTLQPISSERKNCGTNPRARRHPADPRDRQALLHKRIHRFGTNEPAGPPWRVRPAELPHQERAGHCWPNNSCEANPRAPARVPQARGFADPIAPGHVAKTNPRVVGGPSRLSSLARTNGAGLSARQLALERWEQSGMPRDEPRVAEYRALVSDLADEIRGMVERASPG
jgi:hypothetical protein